MEKILLGSKLTFRETNEFVNTVRSKLKAGVTGINIDMKNCYYLNSIMLSGLIRALKHCEKERCSMVLSNINTSAKTLLETTNVDNLFQVRNEVSSKAEEDLLDLSYEDTPHCGILFLKGSLNTSEQCSKFRTYYEHHFITAVNGVLNCNDLFHLSASGVTEMFRLRGLLQEKKGKLLLISDSDSVDSVWKMMHLESLIPRAKNLEHARELLLQ